MRSQFMLETRNLYIYISTGAPPNIFNKQNKPTTVDDKHAHETIDSYYAVSISD